MNITSKIYLLHMYIFNDLIEMINKWTSYNTIICHFLARTKVYTIYKCFTAVHIWTNISQRENVSCCINNLNAIC